MHLLGILARRRCLLSLVAPLALLMALGGCNGALQPDPATGPTGGGSVGSGSDPTPGTPTPDPALGSTVVATEFCTGHAGTNSDPYPASCIAQAVASLPDSGGTVTIPAGSWNVVGTVAVRKSHVVLQGQGESTRLYVVDDGNELFFGKSGGAALEGLVMRDLFLDGQLARTTSVVRLVNCVGCRITGCHVEGLSNASVAAFFMEGGGDNVIDGNSFTSTTKGGYQLQVNPLVGTLNSGWTVRGNRFDSVNALFLGIGDVIFSGNTMTNGMLGNWVMVRWSSAMNGTVSNIQVLDNTLDTTVGTPQNGLTIGGIGQDPMAGAVNTLKNVLIRGNKLRAAGAALVADDSNRADESVFTDGLTITDNVLESISNPSTIDIRGYVKTVRNAIVTGNTLQGLGGGQILTDANTIAPIIANNVMTNQ